MIVLEKENDYIVQGYKATFQGIVSPIFQELDKFKSENILKILKKEREG